MARTMHTAPAGSPRRRRSLQQAGVASVRGEVPLSAPNARSARKTSTVGPAADATARDSSDSDSEVPIVSSTTQQRSTAAAAAAPAPVSQAARRVKKTRAGHREDTEDRDRSEKRTRVQSSSSSMSDGNNYNRDDDDEHNVSDGNDEDTRPVASRRRSERTRTPRPVETSTSARRIASRKNVSTKGRKALKGVLTAADRRRRRAGLVSSQAAGITSEDEDGDDAGGEDQLLSVADDDDSNNSDEDNGGEGPSRTRSLSIAGYQWKAQEVAFRASTVVKSLRYHSARRFSIRVNKRKNFEAGGMSSYDEEADYTDPEDSNYILTHKVIRRGQLVYFLPDPEWLGDRDSDDGMATVDNLRTEDWWLGVILDCAELKYKDGTTACALRIAWCYSPEQAKELFPSKPGSRWAKQLENHDFWDNEMLASDHVDFVGAESTGGRYKGIYDQNALEIAIEEENQRAHDKALLAHDRRYKNLPQKERPPFVPPKEKIVEKKKDLEKVCIRLIIRGLEESDVDRCTPPSKKSKVPQRQRWIEEIHEPTLDRFAEKWAAVLSHKVRRKRFGIPSQTLRRTVATQDERSRKELQLQDLEHKTSGYGGKGKGKGRGKTVLPANPRKPAVSNKRKGGSAGHYTTGGKKVRRT